MVAFESTNRDFYLGHFDSTGKLGKVMTAVRPSGLPVLVDTFVHICRVRSEAMTFTSGNSPHPWGPEFESHVDHQNQVVITPLLIRA